MLLDEEVLVIILVDIFGVGIEMVFIMLCWVMFFIFLVFGL